MVPTNRRNISLYEEAKAGLSSLIKQTALVGFSLLVMLLLTGGNPPNFVVGLSVLLDIAFVAWSEKKRFTDIKQSSKSTKYSSGVNMNDTNLSGSLFPGTSSIIFKDTISLCVRIRDNITRENLLEETRVTSVNANSLRLFIPLYTAFEEDKNLCLQEVADHLKQNDKNNEKDRNDNLRWLEELLKSLQLALNGQLNNYESKALEIQSKLKSSEGKLYRSILYKMQPLRDGLVEFIVIFDEHISRGYVDDSPDVLYSTLLTALNLGSRLRLEVCNRHIQSLAHWDRMNQEAIKRLLLILKNSFENIEQEAELRREGEANNTTNEDRLRDCFESKDEKDTIQSNMLEQEKYKQIIRKADDMQDNLTEIIDALTKLNSLNIIVLDMVGKRFSQVLTQLREQDSP